jgi:hypothetical protein
MTPESLAALHRQAEGYGKAPSDYLRTLTDVTDPLGYWRWAVDQACRICANYLDWRHEQERKQQQAGYEPVVPEQRR